MEGELSRMTTATYIEKTVVEVSRRSRQRWQLGVDRMKLANCTILIVGMGTSPAVLTETVWALAHQEQPVVLDGVVALVTKYHRSSFC